VFKDTLRQIRDRVDGSLAISLIGLDGIAIDSINDDHVPLDVLGAEFGGFIKSIKLSNTDQNSVKVEVIDTGHGISPDDISKVFEPYFSTKETGTGLGLAIVKKAIDDHGGTISVASKEGTGTTFTIILPAKEKGHGTKEHPGS